jgi:hypothetical protein
VEVRLNTVRVVQSRRLQWTGYIVHMEERRTGKSFGQWPLEGKRRKLKDNASFDLCETGCEDQR